MTQPQPRPCPIPAGSALAATTDTAYFHDCYAIDVDFDASPLGYFLLAARQTPAWVNALMAMRNRLVRLFGLKDLGGLHAIDAAKPAHAYLPGERVGIFTLLANADDEALLGDSDKHLDVTLSVYRLPRDDNGRQQIAVSTVVRVHNSLGRLYMLPVAPIHRRIVPAVLSRLARP